MSDKGQLLKQIIQYINRTKKFEKCLKEVNYFSLSNGKCRAELVVNNNHINANGILHTGLMMTMVDVISSWALLSYENGFSGVSSNIHLSHMKPAVSGEILAIDAKVCKISHPLAFLEVYLSKKNTNEIVAQGQHTLFIKPMNHKI